MLLKTNDARIWYEWYTCQVNNFHKDHFVINKNMSELCNYLSLNIPKLLTKELSTYILAEVQYPEKAPIDYEQLLSFIEGVLAIGQGLYIYIDNVAYTYYANNYNLITVDNENILVITDSDRFYILKIHHFGTEQEWLEIVNTKTNQTMRSANYKYKFLSLQNDVQYPYGKSVYADSLDILRSIDMKYTNFYDEFILGKPMVVVDDSALRITQIEPTEEELADPNYKPRYKRLLNDNDKVFRAIASPALATGEKQSPVNQVQFKLRVDEFIKAINLDLALVSKHCGFDNSFMSFDGEGLQTATEVISKKSQLYKNIKVYQNKIYKLIEWICNEFNVAIEEGAISFGDSVISSEEQIKKDGIDLYGMGAIDTFTLLTKYFNYSEAQANLVLDRLHDNANEQLDKELKLMYSQQQQQEVEESTSF